MAKMEADEAAARMMLVNAAACTDGTQACLDAHDALIAALQADLTAVQGDPDATNADVAVAQLALNNAMTARGVAQMAKDAADQATARLALENAAMCTDATQACVDAHNAWISQLQAELADVEADDNATNAQVNLARMAVTNAETARDGVQMALTDTTNVNDAITAATTAIGELDDESTPAEVKAARDLVMAAQTALDDAENLSADQMASLQGMIDGIDTADLVTQETRVAADVTKATTTAALTKETAIGVEAAQTTDAGLGGTDATIGTAEGNYELTSISRDHEATTITVTVHGASDDDDVVFGHVMGPMYNRMTEDDDGNDVEEIAAVWTDIEAPKPVPFAEFESNLAGDTPQALDVSTDTTNDDPTATNEALRIVNANIDMVKADAFVTPAGSTGTTTLNFQQAVEDTDGTPEDESRDAARIAGTFNGSMGTYLCTATGAACTITVDTEGVVSAISGQTDWAFIPADGATTDQSDYDYLHYGFWLKKTTDEDGAVTYNEVETFAGSTVAASGSTADVEGSATYEGGAAGVYVHKTFADDGSSEATSGHFTANALLMVNFGGDDIAVSQQDRLTGTIDGFELSGGEAQQWSVALQSDGDPAADGNQPDTDGVMAGTAKGGVTGGDGSFTATFHGSVAAFDHDEDAATPDIIPQPSAVVGEFNSVFSNGSAAGAFGARKQP